MRINYGRKGTGKPRPLARLAALLLSLVCACGVLTPCALADETDPQLGEPVRPGKPMQDTYVLTVSTGIAPGESVLYFAVRYLDKDGVARTEFILPHDGSLEKGYRMAAEVGQPYERLNRVESVTDYMLRDELNADDGLLPDSCDSYLFTLSFGLSEIIDVDIFMRHGKVSAEADGDGSAVVHKNEWTCNGLYVYRADTLYGLGMAGYWSADRYLDFDGRLVAQMTITGNPCIDFSIGQTDRLFSLNGDKGTAYDLVCYPFRDAPAYSVAENQRSLLFRMDIADVAGAGIEALMNEYRDKKAPIRSMNLCEALTVELEYLDVYGSRRMVMLPFITSAVAWMTGQVTGLESDAVNGIAQQGDTVMFCGVLPDYGEMVGFTIWYGPDAADKAGITTYASQRCLDRQAKLETDSLSYTGFSIYDADKTNISVLLEGAVIECDVNGTPLQVYTSPSSLGQSIEPGEHRSLGGSFRTVDEESGTSTLIPTVSDEMYIVEIVTDYPADAASTADLHAVFTYMAQDGTEKTQDAVHLRQAVSDFMGYWPSASLEDVSYTAGTASGGKLVFALRYPDVRYFKSVELSIDGADDDWQMQSMSVYRVNYLSGRRAEWLAEDMTVGSTVTDRRLYRAYDTSDCIDRVTTKVLLNDKQDKVLIAFNDNGGETREETLDWDAVKYSMTYNETMQDLGFTKALKNYTVTVKVKSNANYSEVYGDCGSVNQFYFQLIFEKGRSAYVQANQQLSADGFRAGMAESFSISVNRDYGDLRAVRILPDDTMNEDDIYDKLNIEQIQVTEKSSAGLSRTWRVRSVGWVDIDFKDTGKNSSDSAIRLRTEYEMTKACQITDRGYTVNLLFVLGVGEYYKNVPYEGTLTALIYYRDSSNMPQTASVDIAAALAEYGMRDPVRPASDEVDAKTDGKALIDPAYMLRAGSVNRFFVSLDDVTSIESVRLQFGATVCTSFTITGLDVYEIVTQGSLLINANNEYQWDGKTEHITNASGKEPLTVELVPDAKGNPKYLELPMDMEANTIAVNKGSWETDIERVPLGDDDTLNIYAYTAEGKKVPDTIALTGAVQYQIRSVDRTYQAKIQSFEVSPDRTMFYTVGLNTQALSALRQLTLKADDHVYLDHAIVQQVRYGVVISTYWFDFSGLDAANGASAKPSVMTDDMNEKQTVRLTFSGDTRSAELAADTLDVAVMFSYTTVNDVRDTVYDTPYIYLTDQQIRTIRAGGSAEVTFENRYVKDIRSVSVVGIGTVDATVSTVELRTYTADAAGRMTCTGVYMTDTALPITRSKQTASCNKTDAAAVELTFTGSPDVSGTARTPDTVRLEVMLLTGEGRSASVTIEDASKYLTAGSFAPGDTAVVRLLVENLAEVTGLSVEPRSRTAETPAVWTLTGISMRVSGVDMDESSGRVVNATLTEGTPFLYNPKTLHIRAETAVTRPDGTVETYDPLYEGGAVEMSVPAGSEIRFTGIIENGLPGRGLTASVTRRFPEGDFNTDAVFGEENHTYVLRPGYPEGEGELYEVVIASEEDPGLRITVDVAVFAEKNPGEPTAPEQKDNPVPEKP